MSGVRGTEHVVGLEEDLAEARRAHRVVLEVESGEMFDLNHLNLNLI